MALWELPFIFQEDLFQTPGLQEELQGIIDCLDTSIPDSIRILFMQPVLHWLKCQREDNITDLQALQDSVIELLVI